jgi:hypothetical protein
VDNILSLFTRARAIEAILGEAATPKESGPRFSSWRSRIFGKSEYDAKTIVVNEMVG